MSIWRRILCLGAHREVVERWREEARTSKEMRGYESPRTIVELECRFCGARSGPRSLWHSTTPMDAFQAGENAAYLRRSDQELRDAASRHP